MKSENVSVKLQGQENDVLIVLEQLKKLYKMTIVGPIKQNDADSGVHVFITINPQLVNKVVES